MNSLVPEFIVSVNPLFRENFLDYSLVDVKFLLSNNLASLLKGL